MPRSVWWSILGLSLILGAVSVGLFLAPGLDLGVATVSVGHSGERSGRQWVDLGVAIFSFVVTLTAVIALVVSRERPADEPEAESVKPGASGTD